MVVGVSRARRGLGRALRYVCGEERQVSGRHRVPGFKGRADLSSLPATPSCFGNLGPSAELSDRNAAQCESGFHIGDTFWMNNLVCSVHAHEYAVMHIARQCSNA